MIFLETPMGLHILDNAVKIDVYVTKPDDDYKVMLAVDNWTQSIIAFVDKEEADVFCRSMRQRLLLALLETDDAQNLWCLMRMTRDIMGEIIC